MKPDVRILRDHRAVSEVAAEFVAGTAIAAVAARDRCALALSGGTTPRETYELLAQRYAHKVPWSLLHIFWGDERCVLPGDPESNYHMAAEALISRVPIPLHNVHRIQGERPAAVAAWAYEDALKGFFGQRARYPVFDLVLLGAGADGHTASLFPDSEALHEVARWVIPVPSPRHTSPPWRVSLTLPVINSARRVLFLLTGKEKGGVARDILRRPGARAETPAGLVRPAGELLIFLDQAAAGALAAA